MRHRLAKSLLLVALMLAGPGVRLAAQPSSQQALESIAADASRYALCIRQRDVECIDAMIAWDVMEELQPHNQVSRGEALQLVRSSPISMVMLDIEPPLELIAGDGRLFGIVGYRSQSLVGRFAYTSSSFMLGVSKDAGQSWRFINSGGIPFDQIERIAPGFSALAPPESEDQRVSAPALERSAVLSTTAADFFIGEGAASYALEFRLRKRLRTDVDLVVLFEDPQNPERPRVVRAGLESGQKTFTVESPLLPGFERGHTYSVDVTGFDSATGEQLFEHRQSLLFVPTSEPSASPR